MKRRAMSYRTSRRVTRRGSKVNKRNFMMSMRGGIRL